MTFPRLQIIFPLIVATICVRGSSAAAADSLFRFHSASGVILKAPGRWKEIRVRKSLGTPKRFLQNQELVGTFQSEAQTQRSPPKKSGDPAQKFCEEIAGAQAHLLDRGARGTARLTAIPLPLSPGATGCRITGYAGSRHYWQIALREESSRGPASVRFVHTLTFVSEKPFTSQEKSSLEKLSLSIPSITRAGTVTSP